MTPNPYEAPHAQPESHQAPGSLRLFTPTAVAIHTLLAPPFGAVLAILNYRRLRDPYGAWKTAGMFLMPGVALVFFGIAASVPGQRVLVLTARAALAVAAYRDQFPVVQAHFATGGRKGRWALGWLVGFTTSFVALTLYQLFRSPVQGQ